MGIAESERDAIIFQFEDLPRNILMLRRTAGGQLAESADSTVNPPRSSDSDSSDAARLLRRPSPPPPPLTSQRLCFGVVFCVLCCFNRAGLLSSRRGAGGGEGEPGGGGAHRQTEAPASPQRALPVPAVREPPRHPHQVGRGRPPLRPLHASLPVSHFLPLPPLSTSPGGSAAWLC